MEKKPTGKKPSFRDEDNVTVVTDISDEDFDTVDEAAQQPLRVTYKHPSIKSRPPGRTSRKSSVRESSGGVTSFFLPPPDSNLWGKIKTEQEELKVKFMAIGDTSFSKIDGWYRLEPITRQDSEEFGINFLDMAYAMKLRPMGAGEDQDLEIIITRKLKRPNNDLPRTGTIYLSYPYVGRAKSDSRDMSPALHEIRRRTLSNKSLPKRIPKKGKLGQNEARSHEEDDGSFTSMDELQFRQLSSAAKNVSSNNEKETEEAIIRILQNIISSPMAKSSTNVGKIKKSISKYTLVNYQESTKSKLRDIRENYVHTKCNKRNLDDFCRKGNNLNFNDKTDITPLKNTIDVKITESESVPRKQVQHYKSYFKILISIISVNLLNIIYATYLYFNYYIKLSIMMNFLTFCDGGRAKENLSLVKLRRNLRDIFLKIDNRCLKPCKTYEEKRFDCSNIILFHISKPVGIDPLIAGKQLKELTLKNGINLHGGKKYQNLKEISDLKDKLIENSRAPLKNLLKKYAVTSSFILERIKTKIYCETYKNNGNKKQHEHYENARITVPIIGMKNASKPKFLCFCYFFNSQQHCHPPALTKNKFQVLFKQKGVSKCEKNKQKMSRKNFRSYFKSCVIIINSYSVKKNSRHLIRVVKKFTFKISKAPMIRNKYHTRKCKTYKRRKRIFYFYETIIIKNKLKSSLIEAEWEKYLITRNDKNKEKAKKSKKEKKSSKKEKNDSSKSRESSGTPSRESMSSSGYSKGDISKTSSNNSVSPTRSNKGKAKDISSRDSLSSNGSKKKKGPKKRESKTKKDSQGGGCCAKKKPKTDEKQKKPPDKEGKLKPTTPGTVNNLSAVSQDKDGTPGSEAISKTSRKDSIAKKQSKIDKKKKKSPDTEGIFKPSGTASDPSVVSQDKDRIEETRSRSTITSDSPSLSLVKPEDKLSKGKSKKVKGRESGSFGGSKTPPEEKDSKVDEKKLDGKKVDGNEEILVYKAKSGDKESDIFGKVRGGPIRLPLYPEPCESAPSFCLCCTPGRTSKYPSQQGCSQRPCRALRPLQKILCKNKDLPPKNCTVYGKFRAVANHRTGELDICVDEQSRNKLVSLLSQFGQKCDTAKSGVPKINL